jgi:hypothetical protein
MSHSIYVTPTAGVWTVKDDDEGCLCVAPTEGQAVRAGQTLVAWFSSHGRPAELRVERSFAPETEAD